MPLKEKKMLGTFLGHLSFILLFSLFLLLFISLIALFDTIHRFHYTISTNFNIYLQYFQQKKFSFSKINMSQTDPNNKKNEFLRDKNHGTNIYIYIYISIKLRENSTKF